MKKRIIAAVSAVLFLALSTAFAAPDDITQFPSCTHCGMDRAKFAHSRMLIEYDDGTAAGLCSLHCAAVELALNIDKTPKAIMVADYSTKSLIDAETAAWVIGGSKSGVMTRTPTWAFATKAGAEAFIKENGGEAGAFESAIKTAYTGMYEDTRMIREKRKMMKHKGMERMH